MFNTNDPKINIRFWMDGGGVLSKVARVFYAWWQYVKLYIYTLTLYLDPLTAPLGIVNILAKERNITRQSQEGEALYRLRVKHAFECAKNAGTISGFYAIFKLLGYTLLNQTEQAGDWDEIELEIDAQTPAWLANLIVDKYGRTCRRYQVTQGVECTIWVGCYPIDATMDLAWCSEEVNLSQIAIVGANGETLTLGDGTPINYGVITSAEVASYAEVSGILGTQNNQVAVLK